MIQTCVVVQAKAKIMVLRDIEREDIEFISKTLNCLPIAHVDNMRPEKLGIAELVEEVTVRAKPPLTFPPFLRTHSPMAVNRTPMHFIAIQALTRKE